MPTSVELLASITRFVDITEPNAFALVNGGVNETVNIQGTEVPTFQKAIADLLANGVSTTDIQTLTDAQVELYWTNLRVFPFASLSEANAVIGVNNVQFYNTTLKMVQMTTSDT